MYALSFILERNTLKAALLFKNKKEIRVELLKTLPIESVVKPLYILAPFLENKDYILSTGLDSTEILFRTLALPIGDPGKALKALPFQLETLLPYPPEETILAPILKKAGKNALNATLFATLESQLNSHLQHIQQFEIDPDIVSCAPIALFRYARWLFPDEDHYALFYCAGKTSFCLCIQDKQIALTHTLHFGSDDLPSRSKEISHELHRLTAFLKKKQAIGPETKWHLCGIPGLHEIFSEVVSSSFLNSEQTDDETRAYALPIGLSLNALSHDDYSVHFRQGKWTPVHQLQRRKKMASLYAGLCAALALLMAFFSHNILHKKETALKEELQLHLPTSLMKNPPGSTEEFQSKLWDWEKSLSKQKLTFPFLPNVPAVSDVLAWLSLHPHLNTMDEDKKIEIKSIRYQMIKYPKLGENTDPYIARVELEFTASSPRLAREFHDALLKGDAIVNGKKEIKWSAQGTSYFTSFELNPLKKGGAHAL